MTRPKRNGKSNVYPHLVGNTGNICRDSRLHPLKMGKKYKKLLQAAEYDRKSKISQMLRVTEQYWELCDLLLGLKRANENNCNFALIMELGERKLAVKKELIFLKSKIDLPVPEALDKAMQKIFNRNNKPPRKKLASTFATRHTVNPEPRNAPVIHQKMPKDIAKSRLQATTPTNYATFKNVNELAPHSTNRNSWRGIVKSQIFVRTDNLQVIIVNIDLFSTGNNLVDVLAEELDEDVKKYSIIFGTKELDMNKTLFGQEIYHGTTVDLKIRLLGGKGKKSKKKQPQVKEKNLNINTPATENPESWNKQQIGEWVLKICHELDIEVREVAFLNEKNGKQLESLVKEDWIRRSPSHGDILFNQWQKLKENHKKKNFEENTNTVVKSVNVESVKEELSSKKDHENKPSQNVGAEIDGTYSTTAAGKFGEVQNLDVIGNVMPLENFSNDGITPTPEFGSEVCVTGISAGTQPCFENDATLFVRDEPLGASNVFHKMKVLIRSNKARVNLQRYNLETLLKEIRTGMHVAVKGRVEKLCNEDNDILEPHCELIRFKLVVDSDNHSLVYVKSQRPQYTRQHSQPWWIQSVGDTSSAQWNLKVGDRVDKKPQIAFCESTASEEIMNYVVAFKNCYDGEILVGVNENGMVTGIKFSEGEMAKWREKLSMAIGKILPESNEGAAICCNMDEACYLVHEKKCFVCVLGLSESGRNGTNCSYIAWVHVPQGETSRVYFKKPSDVHAFIRKGAENKRITNYEELFSSLSSLGSRRKPREISDEDLNVEEKFEEAIGDTGLQKTFKVLEPIPGYENQENELKMVFGSDPTKTIIDKYLKEYTCGFLNASGGTILFGVQEAEKSKCGHIVGIVAPMEKRRELLEEAVTAFSKFYPPISESQFRLVYHKVIVPSEFIVKARHSDKDNGDKFVLLRGPSEDISKKWPKFVRDKLNDCLCRVVPVQPECFCIVVENQNDIPTSEFVNNLNEFTKQNSKIIEDSIAASDLKTRLKQLCMIELKIFPSQYPIHLIKPIDTHVFDKQGNMIKLSIEKMMSKFKLGVDSRIPFDVDKFLDHVENFDPSGQSYVLISSPFELATTERDLHGLVLPQWTLVIDFDQHPKQAGHLFHRFEELNIHLLLEREPFIKTPQDNKLGLNPEHAICWLAARGYDEVEKTLSKQDHGNWNMTHRDPLRTLLKAELTSCVKPNYLHIVVLWDDEHQSLVKSLQTILEDILSINGRRTAVTFVCSTPEARSDVVEYLVKPLQQEYWNIITADSVYVAPPYVLSRHLSYELPTPYQSEDDYQVPHKKEFRGKEQSFPDILPQKVRNNISSYLKVMYMKKEKRTDKRTLENERKKFYSGGEITDLGLRRKFGIEREKMDELEKEFQILSKDKKSHVSMLCLKVDRGAGSTTLCLQFLYKHHKEYPCAQLLQVGDIHKLLSCIRDINHTTKLPLLLFVDDEISHPQEFLDFTKELIVGYRNINVILLLIEPAEASGRKGNPQVSQQETKRATRMKSIVDSSTLRTCPYKVVELRRELRNKETEVLKDHLVNVKKDERTSEKLVRLLNNSKTDRTVRTFAHFGLTAFGQDFLGLKPFVEFRLNIANDKQRKVLSFLSLIHIYTDSHLPASALSGFLESTRAVNLEEEFQDDYLRELLSPPLDHKDSRRISFHEVAEEILRQLASEKSGSYDKVKYWNFIKDVSVDLAKHVLSVNINTKSIDRLTRRLFVTSEYESKKFSALIRAMKNANVDIAQKTLIGLEEVFEKNSSFQAHIRAHLAKYYMIVTKPKNFQEAMPLIEKAVKDQPDDSLLRHIHGDIIRLHVRDLKEKPVNDSFNMDTIVSFAIQSSDSFEFVRRKRPLDSHGYMSDAIVRITVMEAGEKKQSKKLRDENQLGKASFVDYLVDTLDEIWNRGDKIIPEERYLLSLIPDAHQNLYNRISDYFEHKEAWKQSFQKCIGPISNLRRLCEKIRQVKSIFHDFRDENSIWLHGALLSIQSLNNGFEIDNEDLTPEQIEERIKEIEQCAVGLKCPESLMKFWVRYSRGGKNIPLLKDVRKRVKDWVVNATKQNRTSSSAEFYNYVVNVLEALQDPDDRKKREKVTKLQQGKNYIKDNVVVPLEWLNPKEGHHNSIDMLLHHEDLIKEHKGPCGREVIEGYLSKKRIKRLKGTVSEVNEQKLWVGTITYKRYFEVRFMPQSVITGIPKQGQTVSFCLGFDRLGLSAWWVRGEEGTEPLENVKTYKPYDNEGKSSSDDEEDTNDQIMTSPTLFDSNFVPQRDKSWDSCDGNCMQGVVVSTNPTRGFGYIKHPDVPGSLFFHASQLAKPVITLEGAIEKPMVLKFKVEKQPDDKTRATDIHVVKAENILPKIAEFRKTICLLEKGPLPDIGQRVQFTVVKAVKGLEANRVYAVPQSPSKQRIAPVSIQSWRQLVGPGIHEGFVESVSDNQGYIISKNPSGPKDRILFHHKDIQNRHIHDITENCKVHFKVGKRGGKLTAVNINIIATP